MKINFDVKPQKSGYSLRCRVSHNGTRKDYYLSYSIQNPKEWNAKTKRLNIPRIAPPEKIEQFKQINKRISDISLFVAKYTAQCEYERTKPDFDKIKDYIIGDKTPKTINKTIFEKIFIDFLTDCEKNRQISPARITSLNVIPKILKSYKEDFSLLDLNNINFFNGLYQYLLSKNYKSQTIKKYTTDLMFFLRWCLEKNLISNDFKKIQHRIKHKKKEVVFLTSEEMKRLYLVDADKDEKNEIRAFLFACSTGLRFSDVKALKWSDIYEDKIHITTQKTATDLEIELIPQAVEILKDIPKTGENIFNINHEKTNKDLKKICEKAQIFTPIKTSQYIGGELKTKIQPKYELISFHTARKTFVCNALKNGIPQNVIMKWTGHKSYASMMPYVNVMEEQKETEIKKMYNLF